MPNVGPEKALSQGFEATSKLLETSKKDVATSDTRVGRVEDVWGSVWGVAAKTRPHSGYWGVGLRVFKSVAFELVLAVLQRVLDNS